ncbi:uncharacterized protein LOC127851023 isoform X2 [Dreissena polymorpha]|nr:uncharacterized protein LOC127851023 isoform X2 [Dreissena polymorpha]
MKRKLTSIYDTFIDELKQLPSDVGASLETEFGDVRSKLIINRDRLRKMDCTIVVAGETSAGKTSFLNLLLEKDVLPSCHLAATSIICRIHPIPPASKRYFEVHFAGKKFKKYTVSDRDDDDMIAMLKNEVTCRDAKYDGAIVDLYWQIPLLGENYHVTIVDTPGVGENEPMSEKLYKFLPNATAFVYILNSANAGGVQEDKLIQIFRKIYEIEGLEDLFRMDPRCVLFVCNKWDSVDERCRETSTTQQQVWDDTLPKLEKYIQRRNFPLEKNLFKMSTLQARRYLDSDMGYSETYQQVLGGLGRLVVASQVEHSNRHFWWISTIVTHILTHCKSRIYRAGSDFSTKQILKEQTERKLNKLRSDSQTVKNSLLNVCTAQCKIISSAFNSHLNTAKPSIISTVEQKTKSISKNEYNEVKKEVKREIHLALSESFNTDIDDVTRAIGKMEDHIRSELHALEEGLRDVQLDMQNGNSEVNLLPGPTPTDYEVEPLPLAAKVTLGLTAPLWIPVAAVALLFIIPSFFVKKTVTVVKDEYKLKAFRKNPGKRIAVWLDTILKEFALEKMVQERYAQPMEHRINSIFETTIPAKIRSYEILIEAIVSDARSPENIHPEFELTISKMKSVTLQINTFRRKYNLNE